MSEANDQGDTERIYNAVKVLAEKPSKPPTNLTTDGQGNTLECAQDVASTWKAFLEKKFAATHDEQHVRPPMEPLPCTQGTEQLDRKIFEHSLAKMRNGKACGPDGIPAELYKHRVIFRSGFLN